MREYNREKESEKKMNMNKPNDIMKGPTGIVKRASQKIRRMKKKDENRISKRS